MGRPWPAWRASPKSAEQSSRRSAGTAARSPLRSPADERVSSDVLRWPPPIGVPTSLPFPAPLAALLLLGIAPHHFLVVPPCQRRRSLADVCNELVIRDGDVFRFSASC